MTLGLWIIFLRFKQIFGVSQNLEDIMKTISFTISDLVAVIDKVAPLYPAEFDIMKIYERDDEPLSSIDEYY